MAIANPIVTRGDREANAPARDCAETSSLKVSRAHNSVHIGHRSYRLKAQCRLDYFFPIGPMRQL